MCVSASGRGGLLARIDPADTEAALERPHAARMEMGRRTMDGWITVAAEGVRTKRQLAAVGEAQRLLREDAAAQEIARPPADAGGLGGRADPGEGSGGLEIVRSG